ncbi:MAG: hypothetical protein NPINA01_03790 [Nitrospinaceae bacterium]|nr:MAG: hypothetical protein NPINA01_03790 [Nitrospinaceae bacterium]
MAETLGSLVDKLSIKNLRLWHLDEALEAMGDMDSNWEEMRVKRELVLKQSRELMEEINGYFAAALEGKVKIRDEKVKLYDNKNVKPSDGIKELGVAISELSLRNIRCWHLEDEVRREDLPDSEIVKLKRKIDATNQERNDLMDKVDQILSNEAARKKGGPS